MTIFPVLLLLGPTDLDSSYNPIIPVVLGIILGFPLISCGITLVQKRYRLMLYLSLITGSIYLVVPIVLNLKWFAYYIPSVVVFSASFLVLLSGYATNRR